MTLSGRRRNAIAEHMGLARAAGRQTQSHHTEHQNRKRQSLPHFPTPLGSSFHRFGGTEWSHRARSTWTEDESSVNILLWLGKLWSRGSSVCEEGPTEFRSDFTNCVAHPDGRNHCGLDTGVGVGVRVEVGLSVAVGERAPQQPVPGGAGYPGPCIPGPIRSRKSFHRSGSHCGWLEGPP